MTRKLEELFDLPSSVNDETIDTDSKLTLDETKTALTEIDSAIDKIDAALPGVRGLDKLTKWMNWQPKPLKRLMI
jgi:hypothetical protein